MRTTITINDDLMSLIKKKSYETGKSFKEVINCVIRDGLNASTKKMIIPDINILIYAINKDYINHRQANHLAALAIEHCGCLYSTDNDFARFKGLRWKNPLEEGKS